MPKGQPERPKTPNQYVAKFRQILHSDGGRYGGTRLRHKDSADWLALFVEWIHTDVEQYPSIKHFMLAKGRHPTSLQHRGSRMFWNQAREAVRVEAMKKAVEKAPDLIAKRYAKELKASTLLVDVVTKYAKRLLQDPEPPAPPPEGATDQQVKEYQDQLREYRKKMEFVPADAINTLSEATAKLVEMNMKLLGDQLPLSQVPEGFNMFNLIVGELSQRNKEHGVIDAGPAEPAV